MRSRHHDVDPQETIDRAMSAQLCGFGGRLTPAPRHLDEAVSAAERQHDERLARRVERFAAVADGSFVWTRTSDGMFWVGRITGPWHYDASAAAERTDLVHVRACQWADSPVKPPEVPAAVLATFGRGGRNFQQIHDQQVGPATHRIFTARC
jgi:hypothetical protein